MKMENKVMCPLIDDEIEDIDCIENADCVRGAVVISAMPKKYKTKLNWESICKQCRHYEQ